MARVRQVPGRDQARHSGRAAQPPLKPDERQLEDSVGSILASYARQGELAHLEGGSLPSREAIWEVASPKPSRAHRSHPRRTRSRGSAPASPRRTSTSPWSVTSRPCRTRRPSRWRGDSPRRRASFPASRVAPRRRWRSGSRATMRSPARRSSPCCRTRASGTCRRCSSPRGNAPRPMHPWAAAVAGLLILVILWDAFQTIVLSRRVSRKFRPTRTFYRLLWTPWRAAAKRLRQGNRRENLLTVFGPLSLILLIALWALGLIVSFGLLHWGLGSQVTAPDGLSGFGVDLYMSGTTFFTLGLGDVTPRTTLARGLTVLESGMGFAFLALVIGYVPLISQAFSRREVSISMLDARAGSPPTAAQLLRRHLGDGDGDLRGLLRDWERWSAELLESHVSFPVLSYFRSQHDNQSWVAALTTILDVCSLVIARIEDGPALTARLTFAMARHAVLDLCAIFHLTPAPPAVDRLAPA